MSLTIAVIAPGAMGSGTGRRLAENGARVLTSLDGRSAATQARAKAAHMAGATDAEIVAADIILSILPPDEAVALARRFAPLLAKAAKKPIFADCNAIDVSTVQQVAEIIAPTGAAFVDASIVGPPPKPGEVGPTFYFSGAPARQLAVLGELGLRIRIIDGPVGAASALKMSYAGITKGLAAIASAMVLAASRAGAADALYEELADSQPELLKRFTTALPAMYSKAYRWAPEMREIASFVGDDDAARAVYQGFADFYDRIAADYAGPKEETGTIDAFFVGRP